MDVTILLCFVTEMKIFLLLPLNRSTFEKIFS